MPETTSNARDHLQCRRLGFNPCIGKILWRRKWQPTPIFLPGESHGQRSLVGLSPWRHKELDMTKWLSHSCTDMSWTIKKAEHQRTDPFELWCWRRPLRVPWTARRSKQSILKEISPECSLEGLMLKLKLQYFGHLMWRADSLEKTWYWERLKAGGEGGDRGWDGWMTSLT